MEKALQSKKQLMRNRFKIIVSANFMTFRELHLKVEKEIGGGDLSYQTFMHVMRGSLLAGPKAEAIMGAVSELTGKKIATLWPELKDAI